MIQILNHLTDYIEKHITEAHVLLNNWAISFRVCENEKICVC